MTQQRELDLMLDAFFFEGVEEVSDRVIDAALDQIDHTRQRRRVWPLRRIQTMSTPMRLAAAAVIGVLALGGLLLWRPFGTNIGTAPTADPSTPPASAWTPTAGLDDAFERLSATRLPDGRVLVQGGAGSGGNDPGAATATADIYDPATGTWAAAPGMSHARSYPAAALAGDGRVVVAGSDDQGAPADLFDPGSGTWSSTGPLENTRGQPSAITLADGRVLLVGGNDGDPLQPTAEIFDPSTDLWTSTSPMQVGRANAALALLPDDRVLVMGGFAGAQGVSQQMTCEIYDPASDTWTAAQDMHTIRVFASATTLEDGRILIVGGDPPVSGDIYDPSTAAWTSTDPVGVQGDFVVSVLLPDGTVYVTAGGGSGARLDPATGAWSDVDDGPAMPIVRSATPLLDGRVLFIGFNEARTESPAELFDPAALR